MNKVIVLLLLCGIHLNAMAVSIEARGLFANGAILVVNGKQKMLKVGASFRGVTLLEANSKQAIVAVNGKQQTLFLTTNISSTFKEPKLSEVRLRPSLGGHYIASGRINNRSASMMVDTGATMVAMSSAAADAMGIEYRDGVRVKVNTANGSVMGYQTMLESVSVGAVKVHNVNAIINEGAYPKTILLGNSYLSRVALTRQNGVLVLTSKY